MKTDKNGHLEILDTPDSHKKPLKIQDMSLRDGHMALFSVQERTKNMLKHISMLDTLGLYAIQVLTGYSPRMIDQHLASEPWKKIQTIKKYAQKTHLSMTVNNQTMIDSNDDIYLTFIEKAVQNGIDIVRILHPFNEFDNLKEAADLIKNSRKHFQGTICFNRTDNSLGRDTEFLEYYLDLCRELEKAGADSICLADAASLLSPYEAYSLISFLKTQIQIPLHLHTTFSSGMGSMTILKSIEAGIDGMDTCLAPFAFRNSLPALEPLVFALAGTSRDSQIDIDSLIKVSKEMESYTSAYKHLMDQSRTSIINVDILASIRNLDMHELHELTAKAIIDKTILRDEIPAVPVNAESFNVFVDGEYFDVKVSKASQPRISRIKKKDATEGLVRERVLVSPLPGLIVEVKKKVGDTVKIGESVAVLEAMKMLNRLEASNTGVIKEICVKEGDMVEKGDPICTIE